MRTRYQTNACSYLLTLLSTLSLVAGASAAELSLSLATTLAPTTTTPATTHVDEQALQSQVSDLEPGETSQTGTDGQTPIEDETQGRDIKVHTWQPDTPSRIIVHRWNPNVPSKLNPNRVIVHRWNPNVPSKLNANRIIVHRWKPDVPSRIIVHR